MFETISFSVFQIVVQPDGSDSFKRHQRFCIPLKRDSQQPQAGLSGEILTLPRLISGTIRFLQRNSNMRTDSERFYKAIQLSDQFSWSLSNGMERASFSCPEHSSIVLFPAVARIRTPGVLSITKVSTPGLQSRAASRTKLRIEKFRTLLSQSINAFRSPGVLHQTRNPSISTFSMQPTPSGKSPSRKSGVLQ